MDELLWAIIEADREADEVGDLLTGQDLAPVYISDGEGGVFEAYRDGSWCMKIDGQLG